MLPRQIDESSDNEASLVFLTKSNKLLEFLVISREQAKNREYWIETIGRMSGDFGVDAERLEHDITSEIRVHGIAPLLGHLHLCGAIPECFGHDSSEEKLYSKYTDVVIYAAFTAMGFQSLVLRERANVADVECVTDDYSFVADAKSFRLSRTAKNQKDFKIQAMDSWKHGKPYAMVVCPVYQMPSRTSQIYRQAAERSVCIATYTHLAVIVRYAQDSTHDKVMKLVYEVFRTVEAMNPSTNAASYWQAINRTMLDFDRIIGALWREEKLASNEAILISKREALSYLAAERERILRLSRAEAIQEVLKSRTLDNKVRQVQSVAKNDILGLGPM